jgi:hypothetical protein
MRGGRVIGVHGADEIAVGDAVIYALPLGRTAAGEG